MTEIKIPFTQLLAFNGLYCSGECYALGADVEKKIILKILPNQIGMEI